MELTRPFIKNIEVFDFKKRYMPEKYYVSWILVYSNEFYFKMRPQLKTKGVLHKNRVVEYF